MKSGGAIGMVGLSGHARDPFLDNAEVLWSQPSHNHTGFGLLSMHGKEMHYSHVNLNDDSDYEEEEATLSLARLDTPMSDTMDTDEQRMASVVMKKTSWHLLSRFFLLTLLCYLDRTNLSFAALQMNQSLGFDEQIYGLGSGLFYVGYFVSQLPSNLILQRVGANVWLAIIMIAWASIALCFAFIKTAWQFYTLRILLGVAEGGTFPGMWFHLSTFFSDKELGLSYSYVLLGIAVSQVLGAPLAGLIYLMDGLGGLEGWQWLFLLESLPTFLMALWIWRTLAPSPSQSHFLTPPQRAWLVARCAAHAAAKSNAGAQQDLRGALLEYRTWWMSLTGLLYTCAKYSVMYFCPLIIQSVLQGQSVSTAISTTTDNNNTMTSSIASAPALAPSWAPSLAPSIGSIGGIATNVDGSTSGSITGGTGSISGGTGGIGGNITDTDGSDGPPHWLVALLSTLPYLAASLVLVFNTWHSKKTDETRWHVVIPMLMSAVAFMLLPLMMHSSIVLTMIGLMISTVMMSGEAIWMSWMAIFLHGEAAAAGVAIINSIGNMGGLLGNFLLGYLKTHLAGGYAAAMPLLGSFALVAAVSLFVLHCSIVRLQEGGGGQQFMRVAQDDSDDDDDDDDDCEGGVSGDHGDAAAGGSATSNNLDYHGKEEKTEGDGWDGDGAIRDEEDEDVRDGETHVLLPLATHTRS